MTETVKAAILSLLAFGLILRTAKVFQNQYLLVNAGNDDKFGNDGGSSLSTHRLCSLSDESCLQLTAKSLSRAWPQYPYSRWCRSLDDGTADENTGLLLVKVPKSASSTAAAVVLRIQNSLSCNVEWKHGRASELSYVTNRNRSQTFLWAPVRTPESRALSSVYFHKVSFHGKYNATPRDNFIIKQINETQRSYIADYMAVDDDVAEGTARVPGNEYNSIIHFVQSIMSSYDFMMVADRMAESLVAFSLVTDVALEILITMSSKLAGSWYLTGKRCIRLAPAARPPAIQQHFDSPSWKQQQAADRLLYAAANLSLTKTIETMATFQQHLNRFKSLSDLVQQQCANETHFPCSTRGVAQPHVAAQNCYLRDFGCGYPCIDRVLHT